MTGKQIVKLSVRADRLPHPQQSYVGSRVRFTGATVEEYTQAVDMDTLEDVAIITFHVPLDRLSDLRSEIRDILTSRGIPMSFKEEELI